MRLKCSVYLASLIIDALIVDINFDIFNLHIFVSNSSLLMTPPCLIDLLSNARKAIRVATTY